MTGKTYPANELIKQVLAQTDKTPGLAENLLKLLDRKDAEAGRTHMPMKFVVEMIEKSHPDIFPKLYPRMYRDVNQYASPKLPAAVMTSAVDFASNPEALVKSRPMKAVFVATEKIAKLNVPTVFIAPELLEAALRSSPPEKTRWLDLKLPHEAGIMMFPKGFFKDSRGYTYDFVGYARHRKGELVGGEFLGVEGAVQYDTFIVFTAATEGNGTIIEVSIAPDMSEFIEVNDIEYIKNAGEYELPLEGDEATVLRKMMNLIFRLALTVEARPTLYAKGKKDGVHKKSQVEIWTPNIIGKGYQYQRRNGIAQGTHASPRLHWRRGHFRNQHIGPRFEDKELRKHKVMWIEPILVGGDNESAD